MTTQPEKLKPSTLSIVFRWEDGLDENEYSTGASVPQPLTREGIEQAALNVAGVIAKLLEMEGVIRPPQPKGDQ